MNREAQAEIFRHLSCMNTKLDDVMTLTKKNSEELRRITPQKLLHPVPRPKQGGQISRGTNVTKYLRQYTKEKNSAKAEGEPRYEEFSDEIEDKQYNTDAMNCLEWILGLHLGTDLGSLTWDQVCKRYPDKMGTIIRESMSSPELRVFAQAAGQWAIQMLITNKMNSRLRYSRDHTLEENNQDQEIELAPLTVPDFNGGDNVQSDMINRAVHDVGLLSTPRPVRHVGPGISQTVPEVRVIERTQNGNGQSEITRTGISNVGSSSFHGMHATQVMGSTVAAAQNFKRVLPGARGSVVDDGSNNQTHGRINRTRRGANRRPSSRGRSGTNASRAKRR